MSRARVSDSGRWQDKIMGQVYPGFSALHAWSLETQACCRIKFVNSSEESIRSGGPQRLGLVLVSVR